MSMPWAVIPPARYGAPWKRFAVFAISSGLVLFTTGSEDFTGITSAPAMIATDRSGNWTLKPFFIVSSTGRRVPA